MPPAFQRARVRRVSTAPPWGLRRASFKAAPSLGRPRPETS
jgi:hypothetical protein